MYTELILEQSQTNKQNSCNITKISREKFQFVERD